MKMESYEGNPTEYYIASVERARKAMERKQRRMLNICKYELTGEKFKKKRWLGPRSKQLSGNFKRLARLTWDRKRFA